MKRGKDGEAYTKKKNWKRIKIKSIWDEDIKILNKFKKKNMKEGN